MLPSTHSDENLFSDCNHTELYQLCRRLGMNINPATPNREMIAYLQGDVELPVGQSHNMDEWREALMAFLSDHWQVVRAQIDCPARNLMDEKLEPGVKRACFNCIDTQVISCLVQNPENESLIQAHKRNA